MLQALRTGDERTFFETIISITAQHNSPQDDSLSPKFKDYKDYKMVSATHSRSDRDGDIMCSSLKGKTVLAEFIGKILVRNYASVLDTLPDGVPIRSVEDVEKWACSIKVDCPSPNGVEFYNPGWPNVPTYGLKYFIEENFRAELVQAIESI